MDQLPPIPTPPAQRWREFRIQVLPVFTFLAVIICVAVLWNNYVLPTSIVGEVESTHALVISGTLGTLKEVKVQRFQRVKAGDEIARISTIDSETLQSSLRAIEGDLKLMRARMQLDVERNHMSYEAMRLETLSERVELAYDRTQLRYFGEQVARHQREITNQVTWVDGSILEYWLNQESITRTNVVEKEKYLAEKDKALAKLVPDPQADNAILEAIKAQEEALQAVSQPASIKAPIDGMVTLVSCQPGQKVVEDTPLFKISAETATRIVGYLRKPYQPIPKPGDSIQIRKQSVKREWAYGTVLDVSSQLEAISLNLVPVTTSGTNELGLPFSVSIPAELALIPGEPVDLIFGTR